MQIARILNAALAILLLPASVWAQITITDQDMLGLIGRTHTYEYLDDDNLGVNVGAPGGPQTWDFTMPSASKRVVQERYLAPRDTPHHQEFPAANLAAMTANLASDTVTVYLYVQVTPERFNVLGGAVETPNTLNILKYKSSSTQPRFPITYGKSWQSILVTELSLNGIFIYDSTSTQFTADAWGTARVPLGDIGCLRVRVTEVRYQLAFLAGQLITSDTTRSNSYSWYSKHNNDIASTGADFKRLVSASPATNVGDEPGLTGLPDRFELQQNYPNPFNPATRIGFALPADENVTIKIYDLFGREIATLLNGDFRAAGTHSVNFDARELPSGVYFYHMRAGSYTAMRKMLLVQ